GPDDRVGQLFGPLCPGVSGRAHSVCRGGGRARGERLHRAGRSGGHANRRGGFSLPCRSAESRPARDRDRRGEGGVARADVALTTIGWGMPAGSWIGAEEDASDAAYGGPGGRRGDGGGPGGVRGRGREARGRGWEPGQ